MEHKIERERKWLLKRTTRQVWEVPSVYIEQFYDDDGWRYRHTYDHVYAKETFHKLKKISVGRGINHEVGIEEITNDQYYSKLEELRNPKIIRKDRYTFEHEGRKIEIDDFHDIRLLLVEVEDVGMDDTVVFPDWLENEIIMEVTGNPRFNNVNLAIRDEE